MTLQTQAAAAIDRNLGDRVQQQLVMSAIAIANEPANTTGHANRAALARQVLSNPAGAVGYFQQGVASQGLDNTATDAQIANAVNAIWNAYSG